VLFREISILSSLLVDKEETIQIVYKEVNAHLIFVLCCSFYHSCIQILKKFRAESHIISQVLVRFQDIDYIWLHELGQITVQLFDKHFYNWEGRSSLVLK